MREKSHKNASVTAVKTAVRSFFAEISQLSGGGGHSLRKSCEISLLPRRRTVYFGYKSFPHEEFFLMA